MRNPLVVTFVGALLAAATRADHQVVLVALEDASRDGFSGLAVRSHVDGFVVLNCPPTDPAPRILAELAVPYVAFGRPAPDLPQTCVDVDNAAAMGPVVDHLLSRGHERIAYVGDSSPDYCEVERLAGVRDRLAQHGRRLPRSAVSSAEPRRSGGGSSGCWLARTAQRPSSPARTGWRPSSSASRAVSGSKPAATSR